MSSQRARRARRLKLITYLLAASAGASIGVSLSQLVSPSLLRDLLNQWPGKGLLNILPGIIGILLTIAAFTTEQWTRRLQSSLRPRRLQKRPTGSTRHVGIRPPQPGRRRTSPMPATPRVRRFELNAITSILTAATFVVGLFLTAHSININDRQADLAAEQAHWQEKSQADERLHKAAEELSREGPAFVRLPAIHTLYAISLKQDDFKTATTAVNILAGFVSRVTRMDANRPNCEPKRPAEDVQYALTVLFDPDIAVRGTIDLDRTCLWGAELGGSRLRIASLRGANLAHANLRGASLWRGHFEGTIFTDADLSGAFLEYSTLTEASLAGAILSRVTWNDETNWPPVLVGAIIAHSEDLGYGSHAVQPGFKLDEH